MEMREIVDRMQAMVRSDEVESFSSIEMGGLLMRVLALDGNALSTESMNALFLALTTLIRNHVADVEEDILAVRDIYHRR